MGNPDLVRCLIDRQNKVRNITGRADIYDIGNRVRRGVNDSDFGVAIQYASGRVLAAPGIDLSKHLVNDPLSVQYASAFRKRFQQLVCTPVKDLDGPTA